MDQLALFDASAEVQELQAARTHLASAAHAELTRLAYASDWKFFNIWTAAQGRAALPASSDTVELYLIHAIRSGKKVVTAFRYACAIAYYHRQAGFVSPITAATARLLRCAQRERHELPTQKTALTLEYLRQIAVNLSAPETRTVRDRAMILFGFASALRRSNIVTLELADIEYRPQGMLVHVRREKNNQAGPPRVIAIPAADGEICPVAALRKWVELRGEWAGRLFTKIDRKGSATNAGLRPARLAAILKREVESLGLDARDWGAHSMRAGFATTALELGIGEILVAAHTGHRSLASLRRYFRPADPFRSNACATVLRV